MKRRRYISYILTVVCMIMLTASVFPHHHHFDMICLHHNVEACPCSCNHASENSRDAFPCTCHHSSQNACENGCVTKFNCSIPQNSTDVLPYFSLVTVLYSFADILKCCLQERSANEWIFLYIESLHSLTVLQTEGLRAPPCA